MDNTHKLYICDPEKNKECKGYKEPQCGNICFCTTDPDKALAGTTALNDEQYKEEERKRNGNR